MSTIEVMNVTYISRNITDQQQLMYGSNYKYEEMKLWSDGCNNGWMQQSPNLMREGATFVAIGALHLVGKSELVSQLGQQGLYSKPVNIKNKWAKENSCRN